LARELAAVLACGQGAVASHQAAGGVWEVLPPAGGEVDVTVAGRDPGRRPGVRVHCVRALDPGDVRCRSGLPLTSPARTLLDLAETLPQRELERAVEEASIRRLVRHAELVAVLERSPGRRGAARLGATLRLESEPGPTRSEAEQRLLALLHAARLAPTEVNARVGRYEVDALWRPQRLVVEVDGYAYHSTRTAFERDRLRDSELQAAGYRVVRVTWRQLVDEPEAFVARLAAALARA
jgi:very-short-patch-repair endonuclease